MHGQSIPIDWQSSMNLSSPGFQFSSVNYQALFLSQINTKSLFSCAQTCHSNGNCRIFDFNDQSLQCRLFQGNIITMGSLVASSSPQSRVGSKKYNAEQFLNHGQSCSLCEGSRYMRCINNTCHCEMNTYFDGLICQSQKLLGGECMNSTECRSDLNYTCLPRQQCGPSTFQIGVLVGGYGNGTAGNSLNALYYPIGLYVNINETIYVGDLMNGRVIRLHQGSLVGSIVAGSGTPGATNTQLGAASGVYVDASHNIYASDSLYNRVMLWSKNATSGSLVAGTSSVSGNTASTLSGPSGIVVDSLGNLYVSDYYNHRVMKWAPNASNGSYAAGNGTAGNSPQQLNLPIGIYLDEFNSYLYVADSNNHRIQRFRLGISMNGTTVAGGNGQGSASNQLDTPYGMYVSNKTGALYIADYNNHRVQQWNLGATYGKTLAGVAGNSGTSLMLLNNPSNTFLNHNETYLYVNDMSNNRVLRFTMT
ncbi:unnamed protein product [Adineta steineri]|uniref:Apple domain-containing protein n=1 Tax=Adineta steineri TaxID=433720 RepID=A0A819S078_9BILA|nr:unnamed protein product [Adineta steineri]